MKNASPTLLDLNYTLLIHKENKKLRSFIKLIEDNNNSFSYYDRIMLSKLFSLFKAKHKVSEKKFYDLEYLGNGNTAVIYQAVEELSWIFRDAGFEKELNAAIKKFEKIYSSFIEQSPQELIRRDNVEHKLEEIVYYTSEFDIFSSKGGNYSLFILVNLQEFDFLKNFLSDIRGVKATIKMSKGGTFKNVEDLSEQEMFQEVEALLEIFKKKCKYNKINRNELSNENIDLHEKLKKLGSMALFYFPLKYSAS